MTSGRVFVVGSFMMDLVVRSPRRPRAGETIVGSDFGMFLGGKGFNQAVAAARCGAQTAMLGRVGDDEFGARFLESMARDGIDASFVVVDQTSGTGIGAPVVDEHGENSIVIIPRANGEVSRADVRNAAQAIGSADVLLLQLELPHEVVIDAARVARQAGTTVVLNPAPAPPDDLIGRLEGLVDILVPNEVEATALCRPAAHGPTAVQELSDRLGASVVMTLGERGCIVASGAEPIEIPSHEVTVVDSVGAGDAFCGALGAWLSAGVPLLEAVAHANAAGAIAVTREGAEPAMPRRREVVELAGRDRSGPMPSAVGSRPRRSSASRIEYMTLDPHERASYDRDGFLVREAVLSASEVERVRAACEELCEQLVACSREDRKVDVSSFYVFEPDARRSVLIKWEPGSRDVIQGIEPVVHLNPVLAEFGDHPALAEPARDLLDADAVGLFTEKLNVKRSRVGGAYALHRDLPYWIGVADDPESMITALLALDDATAENGAVEVLPGSHLLDDVPLKESDLDLERNEIDPERLDTSAMVPVELAAGSAVFFGPRLIHRSAPNRTSFDRRALLYTYQPSGARDLRTVQRAWLEGEPDPRTAATP